MALVKETLKQSLYAGLLDIYTNRNSSTDSDEDPKKAIQKLADDISKVISDSVDAYLKSGDIIVGPQNIVVTSPAGSCVVAPASPAKIV